MRLLNHGRLMMMMMCRRLRRVMMVVVGDVLQQNRLTDGIRIVIIAKVKLLKKTDSDALEWS